MGKKKLSANILYSGIGCQERGFLNSNAFELDVQVTSEINKEAILLYATLHCGLAPKILENFSVPSVERMISDLKMMNIGADEKDGKAYNWDSKKNQADFVKKYWVACYLTKCVGDISNLKTLPYADLWGTSFPSQSFSIAGERKGMEPGSKTKSSILWETLRLLKNAVEKKKEPKYIIFESMKALISSKFKMEFEIMIEMLDELGYNVYWDVLNANDCGIPHGREMVFVVCIRKDIDKKKFVFPTPFESTVIFDEIMEKDADEKYYINPRISDDRVKRMIEAGELKPLKKTAVKGSSENIIMGSVDYKTSEKFFHGLSKGKSRTLLASKPIGVVELQTGIPKYRIRRYTPKDNLKIMGFNDADADRVKAMDVAETNIVVACGNGTVVNCCTLIAQHLYKAQEDESYICDDELENKLSLFVSNS